MKRLRLIFVLFFAAFTTFAFAQQTTPRSALSSYIDNGDRTRAWEVRESYLSGDVTVHSILLVSQKWHGILWKHELLVCVPPLVEKDGALLFINGGGLRDGMPGFAGRDDATTKAMAAIAIKNNAVTAILRQVPNQPLYGGLVEDELISHTLNEFRKDGDYSWPLLFPMAKSALAAMDAIQEFSKETVGKEIAEFVVSGGSKRGWTTWMAAATGDPRVVAIAPMVIDMLNMPVQFPYQAELYGEYSDQIGDYVELGIPQAVNSEFGSALTAMIDPYSYRRDLTLPKMIVMGTNDPYWTLDAIKHYIDDIPGENLLHYVPNAGHSLGDKVEAMTTLNAFFGLAINKLPYPVCRWTLTENRRTIDLAVNAATGVVGAKLWTASSESRDFRQAQWSPSDIEIGGDRSLVKGSVRYPAEGYIAFYIDLTYRDANGDEFSVCTQAYTADGNHVFLKY